MDCVHLLEEEKQEIETRVTALENELRDTHLNFDALNHMNEGFKERVRVVERVNALLTDCFDTACLHQHQTSYNHYNDGLFVARPQINRMPQGVN